MNGRSSGTSHHLTMLGGVADSGLSSLATFGVGLFAVRSLDPAALGGYAFVFATFLLTSLLPTQLIFTPLEVAAVSLPPDTRLRQLRSSLRLGLFPAVLSGGGVLGWLVFAPPLPGEVLTGLTATGMANAFLSPLQDHIRRMLHIAGLSTRAAAVSGVQLTLVLVMLLFLSRAGVPAWWVPLGALAIANLMSALAGLSMAVRSWAGEVAPRPGTAALLRRGHWLLVSELVPYGSAFVVSVLVTHLAGAAMLGYAEAARVVGQPILVLAAGLAAAFAPRSLRAAQTRRLADARRVSRLFVKYVPLAGILYLAWIGWAWPANPLIWLVPTAYALNGLVVATVVANICVGITSPLRSELVGAGRELSLTRVEVVGGSVRVAIAGFAGALGALVVPLGLLALALTRWVGCQLLLRAHYRPWPRETSPDGIGRAVRTGP